MWNIKIYIILNLLILINTTPGWGQVQSFDVNQLAGQTITLKYDQNDITLEYVGIQFDNPEGVTYQYMLEGLHQDWVNVGKERIARFANLPAGNYTFQVKAANANGVWSEPVSLNLRILPPWWWTWRAKVTYLFLLVGGIYGVYSFQLKRRLALAEASRLRELDEVKTKLYTNITHEFRTPLTVIQGMAGQIEGNEKVRSSIQRNTFNLLNLVNQMLDLSKLEAGNLPVQMIQGDVINYLAYLTESFQSFAESKNIRLHFLPQMKNYYMDYDADKLTKIVANLVSNAIKFTEAAGDVYIIVSNNEQLKDKAKWKKKVGLLARNEPCLILQVRDTGVGIPEDELHNIFDRFYQIDASTTRRGDGSGIGLTFASELTKLLGGSIQVESEAGVGSTFTVILPVTRTHPVSNVDVTEQIARAFLAEDVDRERAANAPGEEMSDAPLILIIEDNADVAEYLEHCLIGKYQLVLALDGSSGLEKALEIIPDLVVSDVMMPGKDGFEVCADLKRDVRTSHIPVILLTAKADTDSRITGLEHGADAYLTKPFNERELLVRIEKLISLRKRLQQRYRQGIDSISLHTQDKRYQLEDSFILKVQKAILENLDNDKFNTDMLCKNLSMSASQLYRKLKALTGKSTAIYIRSIRLAKAVELIRQSEKSISEIAYEVGFKDPAYFSRCFSERYGQSPKSFRNET